MNDVASMFLLNFQNLVDRMENARSTSIQKYVLFPPSDIIRKGNNWIINIALAGYSAKDITVSVNDNQLIVSGVKQIKNDDTIEYQYEGISKKAFERRWGLDPDMEVVGSSFENGLLTIGITKIVPESKKPKTITIGTSSKDITNKLLTV
jgi:molecular chaperone IbpA